MTYIPYLTLTLFHRYFATRIAPAIRFIPTQDCQNLMTLYSQLFRSTPNSIVFLAETPFANSFFDIAVYADDPLFTTYSNLDNDYARRQIYYISNLNPAPADSLQPLTMQQQNSANMTSFAAIPIQLQPKQFDCQVLAAQNDVLTLKDKTNTPIKQWRIQDTQGTSQLSVDVRHQTGGLLVLEKNGTPTAYYYADDQLCREKPVFIAGIQLPPSNDSTATPSQFAITIASRPVFWYYHVCNKFNKRNPQDLLILINNPQLLESVPNLTFTPLSPAYPDPKDSRLFAAAVPIPLSEKSYEAIELTDTKADGAVLIPHLPNPALSSLHLKEGRWLAEIFVYV